MEDHFKKMYTAITTVTLGIQDLNVRLTNIEKQNNQHKSKASATDTSNIQQSFPFKNINEVTAFENRLSQSVDEYNEFVLYISHIGGSSAKENLIRIYRTLFSNEVAKESSWKGLQNHFRISSLKSILMGIQATILDQHHFTNKEFEDVTKEWFRQGGQRLSRQQKDFEEVNPQVI
ncbi:coiled-coil domain-containing protein 65 [Lasius niger]|uniref:Coiled-coil domain-containing protein 65 n=1 Tax=Lasius niger TaxID=67767 RepID=A0A0J7K6U9_LASNI|nr:coiled-coil domain-containing protein 65 [Lasius niger]